MPTPARGRARYGPKGLPGAGLKIEHILFLRVVIDGFVAIKLDTFYAFWHVFTQFLVLVCKFFRQLCHQLLYVAKIDKSADKSGNLRNL